MTQDFAKPHKSEPGAAEYRTAGRGKWFASGFIAGACISFLGALYVLKPDSIDQTESKTADEPTATQSPVASEELQWDFYEIFPRNEVPIVEEYTASGDKVVKEKFLWLLQTGSFSNPDDADELRAELILMGLDATIQEVKVSGALWHRVIVGPFHTDLDKNRAQDKLAQAQIQALPLKLKQP